MKQKIEIFLKVFIILFLCIVISICSEQFIYSQTNIYYIDFADGDNNHDGVTPESAWQHCPGDEFAVGNAAAVQLLPGDAVLFKGGVQYQGTIVINASGAENNPINFIGDQWPGLEGVKAIITGADPLNLSWAACTANDLNGNSNYENIYMADLPEAIDNIFDHQFFANGEKAYIAQDPNISDPFWEDKFSEYHPVAIGDLSLTSIKDAIHLTQSDPNYFNSSYVLVWGIPNVIYISKITDYLPSENTIIFEPIDDVAIYGDRDQYYSIINTINHLDREGEYVIDKANQKIYFWPYGDINNTQMSITHRSTGIDIRGNSNLIIKGLKITAFTNYAQGSAIINSMTWGEEARNIIIKDNEMTETRTRDGRRGVMFLNNIDTLIIENNYIHDCQRNSAIVVGSDNVIFRNNKIQKCGYKGIWSMGSHNIQVLNNDISEFSGTHANAVSIFTSENILVAYNKIYQSNGLLSVEDVGNLIVHSNLLYFVGDQNTGDMVRDNHNDNFGYQVITNNTVINSNKNGAFSFSRGPLEPNNIIVKNNITDGWSNASMECDASHNIYTGLSWNQDARYGWELLEGEQIIDDEGNLELLFNNPLNNDFSLKQASPAINSGVDLTQSIPQAVLSQIFITFPDFNFTKDVNGKIRGEDGAWDIGAYEYTAGTNILSASKENKESFRIYPNPFIYTATIEYTLPVGSDVEITLYDLTGRIIKDLYSEHEEAGVHTLDINLYDKPAGIYFCKLQAGNYSAIKNCVFLK